MPNWSELVKELAGAPNPLDSLRVRYLNQLHRHTKRNIILYYSGWQQKPLMPSNVSSVVFSMSDSDKLGFMTVIHKLDRTKGLDLFIHTPGGSGDAVESLVNYLRQMFGDDIRAIVPQIAMSAGTMLACSCKEIIMGKHSNLGPIDPQIMGVPAKGVLEEFERARTEILQDTRAAELWKPILAKYHPTYIGACQKAIEWSHKLVVRWLEENLLSNMSDKNKLATAIVKALTIDKSIPSHNKHFHMDELRALGLPITSLESDQKLQDLVLSVHHLCAHTLASTDTVKLIENHLGTRHVMQVQTKP